MSYKFYEIKGGRKLSEMTEQEQTYIRNEWDRLCSRETVNTPEYIFIQKPNGRFFRATRERIGPSLYGLRWRVLVHSLRRLHALGV